MTMPPPGDWPASAPPPGEWQERAADVDVSGPAQLERLRELRAEAQDLRSVLERLRKGEATVASFAGYLQTTRDDITTCLESISSDGDTVRHLRDEWEQMVANPLLQNPNGDLASHDQSRYLTMLDEHIRKIEYFVGFLTIPARLNDWLAKARPGYYIPFHVVFEDELPDPQDRVKILNYLAWSPNAVNGGIVDPVNGLIYRYSDNVRDRLKSLMLLVVAFALATLVVMAAPLVSAPGWPLQSENLSTLVVSWGALLAGVLVHIGVGGAKRARGEGGLPPVIAVGDLWFLLNAHTGEILQKVLFALVGLFGLIFTAGLANATPFNAFLVGYSLDSVVELFGSSIERQATVLTRQFSKTAETP